MDLEKIIAELLTERELLDRAIATFEQLSSGRTSDPGRRAAREGNEASSHAGGSARAAGAGHGQD
jgi:hypothetical protein